jgi:hypothetical protein
MTTHVSSTRPSDPTADTDRGHRSGTTQDRQLRSVLDDLALQASFVTDVLPGGWRHLHVPGVERPVIIGHGGVFVLDVRHASTLGVGLPGDGLPPRPWTHEHRHQMSTPQLTAELASQLLSWACGIELRCTPVIVVVGDELGAVASRPDAVEVVHEHAFMRWLQHQPHELDEDTIGLVLEHVDVNGDLIAI